MLQATDFLRGDVAVKGGITTLVKTAHLAEAFRMNYEVHHGGNSLNNVANLHVIASIRNTTFFEVLLPDRAQKYGMEQEIGVGRDGMVHVSNGPGLGAAIDFKLIERKKVADSVVTAIYLDADACPVKAEIYRVAERYELEGLYRQQLLPERAARPAASSWSW